MRRENAGDIFEYRCYPMRSHSETRWASMMDFFGIQWMYEPRLFKTSLGMYLPDFYLPDIGAYVEVKGPLPTEDEIQKAECVQEITGCPVIFAHGKPQMHGLRLGSANLTVWTEGKRVNVSMYEISQWIEKNKGLAVCARMACSGQIQKAPDWPPEELERLGKNIRSKVNVAIEIRDSVELRLDYSGGVNAWIRDQDI